MFAEDPLWGYRYGNTTVDRTRAVPYGSASIQDHIHDFGLGRIVRI